MVFVTFYSESTKRSLKQIPLSTLKLALLKNPRCVITGPSQKLIGSEFQIQAHQPSLEGMVHLGKQTKCEETWVNKESLLQFKIKEMCKSLKESVKNYCSLLSSFIRKILKSQSSKMYEMWTQTCESA